MGFNRRSKRGQRGAPVNELRLDLSPEKMGQCICGLAVIYDIAFGGSLLETGCERKGSI